MKHEGRTALIVTLIVAAIAVVWTQSSFMSVQAGVSGQTTSPITIGSVQR